MLLKTVFFFFFFLSFTFLKSLTAETWIRAGYWYSGSGNPVMDINSALFTHLVFGFAHINTSSYELSISSSGEPYVSTFTEAVKKKNPSVVTLLSIWGGEAEPFVGGEANSSMFFSMVSDSSRRKSFIQSSITKARSFGFHGLEIFGANPDTPENMTNMGVFLDEWRAAADMELNTSRLILTMGGYYSPVLRTKQQNQKMFTFCVGLWINASEKRSTPPNLQVFSFANPISKVATCQHNKIAGILHRKGAKDAGLRVLAK